MARTKRLASIPFNRFIIVASAGLVAFLALMQGTLTVSGYRPCGMAALSPNQSLQAATMELGIAAAAYLIFLLGARRLRKGWDIGSGAYNLAIITLLVGQGLLAYVFIHSTICAN
jgi:hypothetical protein